MSRAERGPGLRRGRRSAGFTLLEVFAVVLIVVVALLGTSAALLSASRLAVETNRLRTASRATSTIIERLRSADFSTLVSRYDGARFALPDIDSSADKGWVVVRVTRASSGSDAPLFDVALTVSVDGTTESSVDVVTQIADRVVGTTAAAPTAYAADSSQLVWQ